MSIVCGLKQKSCNNLNMVPLPYSQTSPAALKGSDSFSYQKQKKSVHVYKKPKLETQSMSKFKPNRQIVEMCQSFIYSFISSSLWAQDSCMWRLKSIATHEERMLWKESVWPSHSQGIDDEKLCFPVINLLSLPFSPALVYYMPNVILGSVYQLWEMHLGLKGKQAFTMIYC